MRPVVLLLIAGALSACANGDSSSGQPAAGAPAAPADAAHQGVVGPHGDHTPRHGGLVLMNGDIHYEVVFGADGRHEVWFTDAVRSDLPASVASGVTLAVARPNEPVETVRLEINDTGEAWVGRTRPIAGDGIMVTVRYALLGEPHEIEIPYVVAAAPQ